MDNYRNQWHLAYSGIYYLEKEGFLSDSRKRYILYIVQSRKRYKTRKINMIFEWALNSYCNCTNSRNGLVKEVCYE
jgi:hypothetical protein